MYFNTCILIRYLAIHSIRDLGTDDQSMNMVNGVFFFNGIEYRYFRISIHSDRCRTNCRSHSVFASMKNLINIYAPIKNKIKIRMRYWRILNRRIRKCINHCKKVTPIKVASCEWLWHSMLQFYGLWTVHCLELLKWENCVSRKCVCV